MRTTIFIPDEQRAELLRLAAARGMKGFSSLIEEAVAAYLDAQGERQGRIARALAARGRLNEADAAAMREAARRAREMWR